MSHPLADTLRAAEHAEASDIGRVPVCKIAKATLSTAALLIDRLTAPISGDVLAVAKQVRAQLCLDSECKFDKGCGCLDAIGAAIQAERNAKSESIRAAYEDAAKIVERRGHDRIAASQIRARANGGK